MRAPRISHVNITLNMPKFVATVGRDSNAKLAIHNREETTNRRRLMGLSQDNATAAATCEIKAMAITMREPGPVPAAAFRSSMAAAASRKSRILTSRRREARTRSSRFRFKAARLFIFHWKGWVPGCYNGCGWVQWNPSIVPGMVVNAGSESYMGWVFFNGNWWAWYANQWVGYFPGSLWGGDYTKSSMVQWFGEVYESDPTPETDMGNGRRTVDAAAARLWYPCTVDAAAWVCWIHPTPSLTTPSIPWYSIQNVGGSAHRYGNPGGRAGAGLDP